MEKDEFRLRMEFTLLLKRDSKLYSDISKARNFGSTLKPGENAQLLKVIRAHLMNLEGYSVESGSITKWQVEDSGEKVLVEGGEEHPTAIA